MFIISYITHRTKGNIRKSIIKGHSPKHYWLFPKCYLKQLTLKC